jgi:hypothetical protein
MSIRPSTAPSCSLDAVFILLYWTNYRTLFLSHFLAKMIVTSSYMDELDRIPFDGEYYPFIVGRVFILLVHLSTLVRYGRCYALVNGQPIMNWDGVLPVIYSSILWPHLLMKQAVNAFHVVKCKISKPSCTTDVSSVLSKGHANTKTSKFSIHAAFDLYQQPK